MGSLEASSANRSAISTTVLRSLYTTKNISKHDKHSLIHRVAPEADADMQSFDNDLKTGAEAVMSTLAAGGLSTDFLKQVMKYLRCLSGKSARAVLQCKGIWNNMKLKNSSSDCEESYKLLADEYLDNSLKMLNFCSELDKFLTDARNTHSYIEYVTREWFEMKTPMETSHYVKISEKLKNLRASDDLCDHHPCAARLLEKVVSLRKQQENMLEKLKDQNNKLGKKENTARSWRKVTMTLFIVTVVGLLISMVVTAVLAVPAAAPALGAAFVPLLSGGDWIVSCFAKYENTYKNQQDENGAMQVGTRIAIKELGDIEVLIDSVVNEIRSLLFTPNTTIEEHIDFTMKNIKHKLGNFMKKIEDLKQEAEKCTSEIRKARGKVVSNIKVLSNR